MNHILDNPAWNALTSGNRHLGHVREKVGYFKPAVSPFVALAEQDESLLQDLYHAIPFDDTVILVSNKILNIVNPWKLLMCIDGFQMIYQGIKNPAIDGPEPVTLTEAFVPQMLALTKLTNPGPFLSRTIEFGHYEGIFEGDQLVAMAGQRMHPEGFAEISAVCTDPGHLGKGYARRLLLRQINRIQSVGEVPFLHVKADNTRAIQVYESLGFETRTKIYFHVLNKVG
jgi:ribosomal protein S18 acetylase RimI-like enzyme